MSSTDKVLEVIETEEKVFLNSQNSEGKRRNMMVLTLKKYKIIQAVHPRTGQELKVEGRPLIVQVGLFLEEWTEKSGRKFRRDFLANTPKSSWVLGDIQLIKVTPYFANDNLVYNNVLEVFTGNTSEAEKLAQEKLAITRHNARLEAQGRTVH